MGKLLEKRAEVIMLPTTDKVVSLCVYRGSKAPSTDTHKLNYHTNQHLYFTTDEEIEGGEAYIWMDNKVISQAAPETLEGLNRHVQAGDVRKIVATTDKSLKRGVNDPHNIHSKILPQPSQAFIEKYCQVGGIDEVLIKYTYDIKKISIGWSEKINKRPKVDPDNTITVKLVKDSWNREELINVLKVYVDTTPGGECLQEHCDEWISKNI